MAGFDKDAFWSKILSMYNEAKENNYILKLDEEQIRELKALYIDLYIPMENLIPESSGSSIWSIRKKMRLIIITIWNT